MTPGALGGRASRAASVSRSGGGGSVASSDHQNSQQQQSQAQTQTRRSDQLRKKPSYAMEVYLDAQDDDPTERAPSRNINVQLAGSDNSSGGVPDHVPLALQPPPRVLAAADRRHKSASPPPPQQQQPPPPDRSMTSTPMPKNRLPTKKPPRLQIEESAPLDKNMAISGPLAFPDSRFSVRPALPGQDRIVEQTVDRSTRNGGKIIEVPIASGKSYLYG